MKVLEKGEERLLLLRTCQHGEFIMTASSDFDREKCELCKKKKDLQQSHIIPKFIANWIKETSATGYLRGPKEPNLRLQDIKKIPLLCKDCEQKFSEFESYFANNIFYPFQEKGFKQFSYNETLFKFMVSINWRVLVTQRESVDDKEVSDFIPHIDEAEEIWRKYLMGLRNDTNDFEQHIFFLDEIDFENTNSEIPPSFSSYSLRATDATYTVGEDTVFIYTKLPSIIIVSSIYPRHLEGWINTKIEGEGGKISPPQEINNPEIGNFLISRSKLTQWNLSEKQEESLTQTIEENIERFAESDTLKSLLQKRKINIRNEIQDFPESVKEMVKMVESCEINSSLSLEEQKARKMRYILVAERLSNISLKKAQEVDKKIKNNIITARNRDQEKLSIIDLGEVIILYQTFLGTTKAEREERSKKKLKQIEENNKFPEADLLLMFGFDPIEKKENPYQIAAIIRNLE